jgi:uncharacterized ferritin-like protein (DUF455 family)
VPNFDVRRVFIIDNVIRKTIGLAMNPLFVKTDWSVFDYAEIFLYRSDNREPHLLTGQARSLLDCGELSFSDREPGLAIGSVRFPERPQWLAPAKMPKRSFSSREGLKAFFHALAHIEFIAIYLAWDMVYRFRGLPDDFYRDWLSVAAEEAEHFVLLRTHLQTLGCDYGDFPAHSGLWDHARDTAGDLPARLALVPRCMEARGLDVTPAMIKKFEDKGDSAGVALLTRILTDEIGHVEKGSYWFKYICRQRGIDFESQYRQTLLSYYKGKKPKGPFNREMRIMAGFSDAELDWLEQ